MEWITQLRNRDPRKDFAEASFPSDRAGLQSGDGRSRLDRSAWSCRALHGLASSLRSNRRCTGTNTWHLDEVYLRINGRMQYLWRAADQDGSVLEVLVQPRAQRASGAPLLINAA